MKHFLGTIFLSLFLLAGCQQVPFDTPSAKEVESKKKSAIAIACYSFNGKQRCDHINSLEILGEHVIRIHSIELGRTIIVKCDFTLVLLND